MIGYRNSGKRAMGSGKSVLAASVVAAAFALLPSAVRAEDSNLSGRGAAPANANGPEWFREGQQPAARADEPTVRVELPPAADQGQGADDRRPIPRPQQQPPAPGLPPFGPPPVAGNGGSYGGNSGGYGSSYNGGFPSYEMNTYVSAQVRAATARALYGRAENALNAAFRAAQWRFDASPELRGALREEQSAYEALNDVRRSAVKRLRDDPKYARLLALKQDIAAHLEERRAARDITPNEVLAMATLKMAYAVDMRLMEGTALNNEPGVKTAQDRLVAAGGRVAELRSRHQDDLRTNSEIVTARQNLEDARVARITADAYLRAATQAGSEALDYAYYNTRRRGYYNSGYGNGYDRYTYGY